ncbi:MAG: flagellar motor stator protein MotA [Sphingomonadaceae bacterium]|uniref:flagellar motor stator protein MotA n=1 Tax=Thermaurantiacus sp. TaxID=2820283 RepID=UPI00298F38B8|nr:flagellar motor stator protein MotA [Thermaurantiacus sp.]MCS6985901.1 flagellar motor stator protein MotA [Sphingomonadaceae bacterium]MDW8414883.1 flagellar motor stator protein MotA [Thermaurantiacus sp.]
MLAIVGMVVLLVMVFGGFALAGGNLGPVFAALPHELMIIGGAAVGALLIGNSVGLLKQIGAGIGRVLKGPRFTKADYLAAIALTVKLMRLLKSEGAVAVEPHVEQPQSSALWAEAPKLRDDPFFVHLVTDTLRLLVVSTGTVSSVAIEDVLDTAIETHHHHATRPAEALQTLADALPALGIVAAVLGVIKTMGAIDQPPAILGAMIGSALVGTFLGVFLAYGLVGPLAGRLRQIEETDAQIYQVARRVILASLRNQPQPIVLEQARTAIAPDLQPSFTEVFEGARGR